MSVPPDRPLSESHSAPGPRPPQFTLRTALLVVTACCVLFAALAAVPGRARIYVIVLAAMAVVLACAAKDIERGFAWLLGGAAVGLAAGVLLGAALVTHAYGPVDKRMVHSAPTVLCVAGPIAGGLFGLGMACVKTRVAIAASIGSIVPLVVIGLCLFATRGGFDSGGASQILKSLGVSVAIGASLGVIVSSRSEDPPTPLYLAAFVLLATLLGSCCLRGLVPSVY